MALALVILTTACAPSSNSEQERIAAVVAAVKAADARVTDASAEESVSGLSSGWAVDIVLDGSGPVTADELRALLLAARHAGDADSGHIYIFATDQEGAAVDLAGAADELGVSYSDIGSGIGVVRDDIDRALGGGE